MHDPHFTMSIRNYSGRGQSSNRMVGSVYRTWAHVELALIAAMSTRCLLKSCREMRGKYCATEPLPTILENARHEWRSNVGERL